MGGIRTLSGIAENAMHYNALKRSHNHPPDHQGANAELFCDPVGTFCLNCGLCSPIEQRPAVKRPDALRAQHNRAAEFAPLSLLHCA